MRWPIHPLGGASRGPGGNPECTGRARRGRAMNGSRCDWNFPGDYDGDGRTDIAIFRPRDTEEEGIWYVVRSSDGGVVRQQWGAASLGDQPVPADYDGDGRVDFAVWRSVDRVFGRWHIIQSSDGRPIQADWGSRSDFPVPADYDGDGKTDLAVRNPPTGEWKIVSSRDGSESFRSLGGVGDVPVPADYDGDGKSDLVVYRP